MTDAIHPARTIPSLAEIVRRIDDDLGLDSGRPIPVVAIRVALNAAHNAYQAGRHDAIRDLRTIEQAADDLGISVQRVRQLVGGDIGWQISRGTWLLSGENVATLAARNTKPGAPKREEVNRG